MVRQIELDSTAAIVSVLLYVAVWLVGAVCCVTLVLLGFSEARRARLEDPQRSRSAIANIALGRVTLRHWVLAVVFGVSWLAAMIAPLVLGSLFGAPGGWIVR
jgi:hypothetical protein